MLALPLCTYIVCVGTRFGNRADKACHVRWPCVILELSLTAAVCYLHTHTVFLSFCRILFRVC